MNTKIIKFDLNKKLYEKIIAKQGDTKSRFLLFNLLDGAVPFNLANRSVRVYGLKKDGTEIFNDLIINNATKGYCTLELTNQMLALAGEVQLELMIIEGDKKLTSNVFTLEVRKSINSEKAIVSTNEFTALLNGLASLNEYDNYKNEIKEARGGQTKLKNRLDTLDSHLEQIENYEIFIKTIGEKDITSIIKGAISSIEKGIINIPKGNFTISEDIIINKPIILNGAGSSTTNIDFENDCSIIFTGNDSTQTYLSLSGLGINKITLNKQETNTRDCLQFIYVARGNCDDLVINRSGGNGIYFRSSQDMSFYNCYLRYCGNKSTNSSAIKFDEYKSGHNSSNNVNEIKFIQCTFEHDNGALLISNGNYNNSNSFIDCKFEYGVQDNSVTPIQLINCNRYSFDNCRFTHTSKASETFLLQNCWSISINGKCYNDTTQTTVVNLIDSSNCEINLNGRNLGTFINVKESGNSINNIIKLRDTSSTNESIFILDEYSPNSIIPLNIICPAQYCNIENGEIVSKRTTINEVAFNIPLTKRKRMPITLTLEIKSNVEDDYGVYIRGDKVTQLNDIRIGTDYKLIQIPIPPDLLFRYATLRLTFKNNDRKIYIKTIYWEDKFWVLNKKPEIGYWNRGDVAYNLNLTKDRYFAYVCITNGYKREVVLRNTAYDIGRELEYKEENGFYYKVITKGITAQEDVVYPTKIGDTVTDGTCILQCVGIGATFGSVGKLE